MEGRGLVLMAALSLLACLSVHCDDTAMPVSTVLRASWKDTPLLLEASEFMAEYKEPLFWDFVNQTKSLRPSTLTDKDTYNTVLEVAESLLPSSVYNLLVFSLSLRQYSPAIEMFQQVAVDQLSMLSGRNCVAFVQVGSEVVCSPDELDSILNVANISDSVFEFDHIHSSSLLGVRPLAVLYAELGTREFEQFHDVLVSLSNSGRLVYVLRHYIKERSSVKPLLSGYGVQLSVKSTEYKAMDDSKVQGDESRSVGQTEGDDEVEGFLFTTLRTRFPDMSSQLDEFRSHLVQGAREMPELKVWQLQDLGFQACQRIISSTPELALKVMKDIAQNLPMQAKSLSRTQVSKDLWNEITKNQKLLQSVGVSPGDNILLLNDIVLAEEQVDIYHMVDLIMSEVRVQETFHHLSIAPSFFRKLISVPVHSHSTNFAVDVRSDSVVFINDLEKDRHYSSWPRSLKTFLQPAYPGMLRQIAKNVFNILFILDPTSEDGKEMVEYVKLFLDHMVPARLGLLLVPRGDAEVGVAICRGFSYLVVHESPRRALAWLYKVQSSSEMGSLTVEGVTSIFQSDYKTTPTTDVFNETYDTLCQSSLEFFEAKGFASSPQVLVNGAQISMETDLEMSIVGKIQQQTYEVQQAVFTNRVNDKMNIYDYFMNRSNVLTRVNQHVVAQSTVHNLCGKVSADINNASPEDTSATVASSLHYITSKQGEFLMKELSVWVVVDLGTEQGRQVARNAISYTLTSDLVQVALVHNPTDPASPPLLATAVQAILSNLSPSKVWPLVTNLLDMEDPLEQVAILSLAAQSGVAESKMEELLADNAVSKLIQSHTTFSHRVLQLEPGQSALLSNGKLIGPLSSSESFLPADFAMLHQLESSSHAAALSQAMEDIEIHSLAPDDDTVQFRSELLMKVASLLRSQPKKRRLSQLPKLASNHSAVHLPGPEGELNIDMVVFLDPLSPSTQRLAPLLQTLHVALNLDLTIYLNPISKLSQIPINSFYRYILDPELSFTEDGRLSDTSLAVFSDLPHSPLLTLQLDVPHSWLVEAVWSPHDLDNIHLASLPQGTGVHADFQLKHILVEGQCFDESTDHPTPGLEYVLGTSSQPNFFDTIVMANLGYFQLKASPGAWSLRLRQGRSSEIYEIKSHLGGDSRVSHSSNEVPINVNSFRGSGAVVRVAKQPGMESVSLLAGDDESASERKEEKKGNLWNTLSNFLHGGKSGKGEEESGAGKLEVGTNETINVFSIASGHLYERFLRIMMMSVLKHTKNPVKFWFLKNFLSPPFKDFIPVMAERYGFEYELVEYQWPRWLHGQTQKMRIIWGYKILFLDVLFPLSVKKIIFVDADQIVRADLKELLEIPLDGAPYGYTPFCNDRPDMAGFRFWESGYWKNHLGNRRYHISALYVVDLMRFRQLAAGDRLRGQYQALSQDPNSLANLDQDLPNNMIHMVPIKSLPQEWLWCETWCSQESKAAAKTIDLCNNPLTKEPKLQSAVRIVSEWTGYDQEIKGLWEEHFRAKTTPTESPVPHTTEQPSVHVSSDKNKHSEL